MFLLTLGVYQDIINEHHNKLIQKVHKHFIMFMKYAGALVKANGITVYSYIPYLVVKAVFGISNSLTFI